MNTAIRRDYKIGKSCMWLSENMARMVALQCSLSEKKLFNANLVSGDAKYMTAKECRFPAKVFSPRN
jgi:hypothetical protein